MARVVVVGGGFGGIACAVRLAKLGHAVTLLEARHQLGGALGLVSEDGYTWDTGPTSTALPAVVRDLFRKSGRPLERELALVPVEPARQHRFDDGTRLDLPAGSRAAQKAALTESLGVAAAQAWLDYTAAQADEWEVLRRAYLEKPWSEDHADKATRRLVYTRETLHRRVTRTFKDERLRALALHHAVQEGHDPRNVPAWWGVTSYVEQNFGLWTVPGGFGRLTETLTGRLAERKVTVETGTAVTDIVVRGGTAVGVETDGGPVDAEVVVLAVDPRRVPALAEHVRRTMPALPPVVCHLGLEGDVPDLPHEVVVHDETTLALRTSGGAPEGHAAWTVLGRGTLAEDLPTALARAGIDVRAQIRVRHDHSPRELVETWHGSPYGVLWQGRSTLTQRLSTTTPIPGVYAAGAHSAPGAGIPYVGLGAALVAQAVGPA